MAYASLIGDTDIIQGDSSEIYLFGESTGSELDDNWCASFSIRENHKTDPVISRILGKDAENMNFVFQLFPHETEQLTEDKTYLVGIEIKNPTINFNAEIAQYKLKILKQLVNCVIPDPADPIDPDPVGP